MQKKTQKTKRGTRAIKCGAVEGPTLPKGWACCACYREHGVGIYNAAKDRVCKQCGHKRCVGASKRVWPHKELAVPQEVLFPGLTALARVFGAFAGLGSAAREPKPEPKPEQDPKWVQACDDVVAAFASAQLRAEQAGEGHKGPPTKLLAETVKTALPRAVQIFGRHPTDAPPCKCRHYSLIAAGAEKVSEMTGQDFAALAKSGQRIVDWYLASRS